MRRILITESQLKKILGEDSEVGYPLNLKDGDEQPDGLAGITQIQSDNSDKDALDDVTDLDNLSSKRTWPGWFGINAYPSIRRIPEGRELDNVKNSGFGINNDRSISSFAQNGGGKMVKNVNAEVQSNTEGSRNATNMMRKNRMEQYRQTNPQLYQKNGGDEMLKILDDQTKKQSSAHKIKHASDPVKQSTTPKAFKGKGHTGKNGAYYFE